MAIPSYRYFDLTGDSLVDSMTHGYYWSLNSDKVVDFSVSNGFEGEYWSSQSTVNYYLDTALNVAFGSYANIQFKNLGNFANPNTAYLYGSEINLTLSANTVLFPSSSIWAMGFFDPATSTIYSGQVGDVYLNINSQANYLTSYDPGSAGWALLLHELGHVLGLKHPHDSGGTGRPTFAQVNIAGLNFDWATVMSYNDSYNWNLRQWSPATPMILDVLALQYLYGKNTTTNAGDSVLNLNQTNFYMTLWDPSGNDIVSASASAMGWYIYLPQVQLSTLVDTQTGVALPLNEMGLAAPKTLYWLAGDMESAQGSNYADVIIGNSSANAILGAGGNDTLDGESGNDILVGGAGNDTIGGGIGTDTASFSGTRQTYKLSIDRVKHTVTVSDQQSSRDGVDTVTDVEKLQFDTQTFSIYNNPITTTPKYGVSNAFLFDAAYYLLSNPALSATLTLDTAAQHYLTTGAKAGLVPNDWFSATYYANKWVDLKNANLDAATLFQHYNLYGVWEGRSAGTRFDKLDGTRYLANNPDVAAYVDAAIADFLGSRTNGAIAHYIIYGAAEGRVAFDTVGTAIDSLVLVGVSAV